MPGERTLMAAPMKKALPDIMWQNVAPPYYDYEYFQHWESYPFHPTSTTFDLVNAWWLSEAAALVYAEEEFVRPRFQSAGFPDVKYFDGESTDCFVASNEQCILVLFRGTESQKRADAEDYRNIIADVKADCNILLVDSGCGGNVHKGFHDALNEIWDELFACITSLHTSSRPIWIAGHSLGAALATLAAARYQDVQAVYTFGSPRVGDYSFKERFSIDAYRIVNNNDIVTTVPPPGIYRHVGELWYINSDGFLQHDASRVEMWTDGIRGEVRNISDTVEHVLQGAFTYVPGGIKDHVPLLYAVHLWNTLVDGIEE